MLILPPRLRLVGTRLWLRHLSWGDLVEITNAHDATERPRAADHESVPLGRMTPDHRARLVERVVSRREDTAVDVATFNSSI